MAARHASTFFSRDGYANIDVLLRKPAAAFSHTFAAQYAGLGNVERAAHHWETATQLDPSNPRAWRNLGLVHLDRLGNLARAQACYEKALDLAPKDSAILLELDRVREAAGAAPGKRLALLTERLQVVKTRDALVASLVRLRVRTCKYGQALELLMGHHFAAEEGNYAVHHDYMAAHIGLAEQLATPREALRHYERACQYPANLQAAAREPDLRGFLYYPMASLQRKLGDAEAADRLLRITAGELTNRATVADFYRALALGDLGRQADASSALSRLEKEARALIDGTSDNEDAAGEDARRALGHYYLSKVHDARGEASAASRSLATARGLDPDVEQQARMRAQLVFARATQ